ncbi:DUF3343 domain-containing protein [Budvicia aquatica]|uniref:DUF3343 domain-containing protein n=1 Tax=Budvicia aquatica TaxID=82979 RepID=UPI00208C5A6F|nr:DUF3343 domain-containing protein [Budvicia aquatica]GKX49936.1 hypothetical protein SOASR029_02450 [Budvicia aquatica]
MNPVDYQFLFYTPLGVILLKKQLMLKGIEFCVMDAPRQLSAECGMSVRFSLTKDEGYRSFISPQVSAVYRVECERYISLWQDSQ